MCCEKATPPPDVNASSQIGCPTNVTVDLEFRLQSKELLCLKPFVHYFKCLELQSTLSQNRSYNDLEMKSNVQ